MIDYEALDYTFSAAVTGNKDNLYINPCNCNAYIDARQATNFKAIDFKGVNHIGIHRNDDQSFYIFFVSGYTYDKGMFIDNYTKEGRKVEA